MTTPATTIRTAARIRQEFLDFFRGRHDHTVVPSSPVVPHDDPTLLFTNAGMNQFKDVFLGQGERPYRRAVDTQKCIRAGGKHNDLEDVGKDTYHHTYFEMLGNWSFGDYFKTEAIEWAWTLLTEVWGVDPDRLYVTVFAGHPGDGIEPDGEAEGIWSRLVPAERISRWGRKHNFWEMGESGPCGPCSEIHYDCRPDAERAAEPGAKLVNRDHPGVVEIWNLVFIQYCRGTDGRLSPLPAKHVDTGMGLERVTRVLQDKASNYDTDLWTPIFAAIQSCTGVAAYGGGLDDPVDLAYRIVADHVRCLVVAMTDGAAPSNEGRGYVLRRILRRAVRHARQTLGVDGPLLADLVPAVVESLGGAFPELADNPARVADVIRDEETNFLRTLDRGIALFEDAATRVRVAGGDAITAEDAFKLHDTFGFPIDLTRVMAEERGMGVDETGFETLMAAAREISRRGGEGASRLTLPPDAMAKLKHLGVGPTRDDDKYPGKPVTARVEAIWNGADFDNVARPGRPVALVLTRTNHYAESGGQVGDQGAICSDVLTAGAAEMRGYGPRSTTGDGRFAVDDTIACGGYVLHEGRVTDGTVRVGDAVQVTLDRRRREPILANHTGTHLLNHALREVLGDEVEQRGSLVAPDRLRFDFACAKAMTSEQIERTESLVTAAIEGDLAVDTALVPLEQARRINGVRAVFGERYPDPVRVVSMGAPVADLLANPDAAGWCRFSVEFCGGTHLARTTEVRSFVIVQEQALASGVRRLLAVTGAAALAAEGAGRDLERRVEAAGGLEDESLIETHDDLTRLVDEMTIPAVVRQRLRTRLDGLRDRIKAARKAVQSQARRGAADQARTIAERHAEAPETVIVETLDDVDRDTLLAAMDVLRARCPESAVILFAPDEEAGKVTIAAAVPEALIARGLKAGDWVRVAAEACGGNGGGRNDLAQAGGKDPSKVDEARTAARTFAEGAMA